MQWNFFFNSNSQALLLLRYVAPSSRVNCRITCEVYSIRGIELRVPFAFLNIVAIPLTLQKRQAWTVRDEIFSHSVSKSARWQSISLRHLSKAFRHCATSSFLCTFATFHYGIEVVTGFTRVEWISTKNGRIRARFILFRPFFSFPFFFRTFQNNSVIKNLKYFASYSFHFSESLSPHFIKLG